MKKKENQKVKQNEQLEEMKGFNKSKDERLGKTRKEKKD